MNREQWYSLLASNRDTVEEKERITLIVANLIDQSAITEDEFFDKMDDLLGGLIQVCANIASRIDSQR